MFKLCRHNFAGCYSVLAPEKIEFNVCSSDKILTKSENGRTLITETNDSLTAKITGNYILNRWMRCNDMLSLKITCLFPMLS